MCVGHKEELWRLVVCTNWGQRRLGSVLLHGQAKETQPKPKDQSSRASGLSQSDSASSLGDSHTFKLSVNTEAEVTRPCLSVSAEGEVMASQLSVSAKAEVTPPRLHTRTETEATPLQLYRSTAQFQHSAPGELSLPAGVIVEVLEKQQSGWWFVRWGAQEGWFDHLKNGQNV
uniref:SH3 domain-containing protein n=1 Tax=Astyanax mexicanus TaxID=7994 RepID=A0A8B9LR35_ASTMX